MKKIIIFGAKIVKLSSCERIIGGLQTYTLDLAQLFLKKGYDVYLYQLSADCESFIEYQGIKLYSYNINPKRYQRFFNTIFHNFDSKDTLFIINTDQMNIRSYAKNVITIQHGIAFDIPGNFIHGFCHSFKLIQFINKFGRCVSNVIRYYRCMNTVCVDYNFYNWIRTLGTVYPGMKTIVIPNYSSSLLSNDELKQKIISVSNKKKIIFARRFVDYRGTILFANVVKKILIDFENVEVTFAGTGPLESILKKLFKDCDRVFFEKFNSSESVEFHKKFDIAVVPTIYSEGTSLSLLEAMGAACLPVATHVGGMTNIILDRYNGFFCSPTENSLYKVLKHVLTMPIEDFREMMYNAHYSVLKSFTKDIWEERWISFIESLNDEI